MTILFSDCVMVAAWCADLIEVKIREWKWELEFRALDNQDKESLEDEIRIAERVLEKAREIEFSD